LRSHLAGASLTSAISLADPCSCGKQARPRADAEPPRDRPLVARSMRESTLPPVLMAQVFSLNEPTGPAGTVRYRLERLSLVRASLP
jgi:hypothetical protein